MAERHTWWRQMPWHDPIGRVAPVKLALFVAMWLPAVWMALSFSSIDWMFPSPFVPLIYHSGLWATYLLLLSLAITPVRRILEWGRAAQLRRMIGVAAFAYTLLHIVAWLGLRFWDWSALLMELLARPSLWVAALSAAGLLALAATSFDSAMRRMGGLAWKNLHRMVYVLTFLAVLHFLMSPGSLQGAPFLMAGIYVWLMGWRLIERHRLGRNPGALALLGTVATLVTLFLQPLWLATFQSERSTQAPLDALAGNLDAAVWIYLGPPPVFVMATLSLLAVAAALPWRSIYSHRKYQSSHRR